MRMIDADKFILALMDASLSSVDEDTILDLVDSIPTVDAVPVVRCKDCKYSCKDRNGRTCEGYWHELSEFAVPVKDDGFCSYAEPRMDGGEE